MHIYSSRMLKYLSGPQSSFRPWSPDALQRVEREHGPLSKKHWEIEKSLFEAGGRRGSPVIGPYVFGAAECLREGNAPLYNRSAVDGSRATLFACSPRGGLYVSPSGSVEDHRGYFIGREAHSVIERLAMIEGREWLPMRAVLVGHCPDMTLKRSNLRSIREASDGSVEVWADEDALIVTKSLNGNRAYFGSFESMSRVLRALSSSSIFVYIESDSPVERIDSDDVEWTAPLESKAQYNMNGERLIGSDPSARLTFEATGRKGRVVEKKVFHRDRTEVTRYAAASRYLEKLVSNRVVRHCDIHGLFRDPTLAGGFDALATELERRDLPFHDAWFEFEEKFGGIAWENIHLRRMEMSLGIWQCLSASVKDEPAWRIKSGQLAPDVWPTARFGERHLILAGAMDNFDDQLFVDDHGVVYRLVGLLDELSAEATDGRSFLEKMAAEWEMYGSIEESAPTTIDADMSEELVGRLSLSPLEEASDAVSRVFRSDQLWVWQHLAFASNTAKTTLVARTPQAVVDAVKIAREIDPSVGVSVRRDLPGGRARLSALRAAGMSVREMF
ncbi:hypothetical protein WME90_44795 [Sorangium sp. So ce375]|uniref:hypothetical protein n=1 Tax=Sorangium sp. So ce375 TaxID=3133306 RepID=UPI003F5BE0AD